jgi:hypothetical protein
MDGLAAGRPYIWQQDGAPAHTSKKAQEWCRDNLPFFWKKEIWPPSSSDCNPMDYFVWGISERDVNRSPHPQGGPQEGLQQVPVQARGGC